MRVVKDLCYVCAEFHSQFFLKKKRLMSKQQVVRYQQVHFLIAVFSSVVVPATGLAGADVPFHSF